MCVADVAAATGPYNALQQITRDRSPLPTMASTDVSLPTFPQHFLPTTLTFHLFSNHCIYILYLHNPKLTTTQASPANSTQESRTTRTSQEAPPSTAVSKQPSRPNIVIHYPLFTSHTLPMPAGPMRVEGWAQLTTEFPERDVIAALLGICRYGARIGYKGERNSVIIHPNLATAESDSDLVTADIVSELQKSRLETYPDSQSLPPHFTASPLGLTDKADGGQAAHPSPLVSIGGPNCHK